MPTPSELLAAAELVENMEPYDCEYIESLPTGWYEAAYLLARHVKSEADETWLDQPTEAGWWWYREGNAPTPAHVFTWTGNLWVTIGSGEHRIVSLKGKWQKVQEPTALGVEVGT